MRTLGGTITLEHELWYQWAKISVSEASASQESQARREGATGMEASLALDASIDHGLMAICSAAFAMEALSRRFRPMVVDENTIAAWECNDTGAATVLKEVLRRSLELDYEAVKALVERFKPVIRKRGAAVHYNTVKETPVELDDGSFSTSVVRDYGPKGASDAVAAMRAICRAVLEHPGTKIRPYVMRQEQAFSEIAALSQ